MGLATFKGGIHPYEGKELSENKPIKELLPEGDLVFPMSQHIGAPAKPLVKKGDRVLAMCIRDRRRPGTGLSPGRISSVSLEKRGIGEIGRAGWR